MTSTAHTAATDRAGRRLAGTTAQPPTAAATSAAASPGTDRQAEYRTLMRKWWFAAGQPVRLLFRREETAACSEQVVLADFGKSAPLPIGTIVPIEFMPGEPGEHEFTCQMGMLRGRIIVEAS